MQLEKLQRVEAECEQLREKLREMTSAEERLKLEAQQSEFGKIKAEEEARRLRDETA